MLPSLELPPRESLTPNDASGAIRERHLEYGLCEIHCHRRSIHIGLLLVRGSSHSSRQ
jgi:hypothetical protein